MMHVPNQRMSCWTNNPTPRIWLQRDKDLVEAFRRKAVAPDLALLKDLAVECKAFPTLEILRHINGRACDGCARCLFTEIQDAAPLP